MDITEVILFQHHQQRRMFALLDDIDRGDTATLHAVWSRLANLLEVHAAAEEKFFYPRLLEVGKGAGGADSVADETADAIKDHNEIRDAVAEANRHDTGTDDWWKAVIQARIENSDHMAEEEREDLADFRRHADLQTRHDIAVEFLAYEAAHADGIEPVDRDPEDYVDQRS
ncbi:MAG: hemerythrin domain-containing protein [Nocardioidaceae bacterium]